MWSSPISASTPPCFEEPAMLAWRKTSPERSTPGPLPYHMPKTPSYLPSPRISACCEPQTAVAASSSLRPGWKTMLGARATSWPGTGSGRGRRSASRDSPETKPAVLSPARRSRSRCISSRRTMACVPVMKTRSLVRSYLSSSVTFRSAVPGSAIARSSSGPAPAVGSSRSRPGFLYVSNTDINQNRPSTDRPCFRRVPGRNGARDLDGSIVPGAEPSHMNDA